MTMWSKCVDFFYCLAGKSQSFRLYQRLKRYASLQPTTVCMLHEAESGKPCPQSIYFCGSVSEYPAINFDAVKNCYCAQKQISSLSSVDAVMQKKELFLLIEIKSWKNFEKYQIKATDSEVLRKQKIEEKAKKFKLKKKVEESMAICCEVSRDNRLFNKMRVMYVLMTDIDTVVDPMDRFRARLGSLSYKAVNMLHFNDASMAELKKVGMEARYVYCQKFDEFYASI